MTKTTLLLTSFLSCALLLAGCSWRRSVPVELEPEMSFDEQEKMMMESESDTKMTIEDADSDTEAVDVTLEGIDASLQKADQTQANPDLSELE